MIKIGQLFILLTLFNPAWAECAKYNQNGCLSVNNFVGDANINTTDSPLPYLSVANNNNTTTVFVTTYDGHQFTLWQQTPKYDFYDANITFYISKLGDYLGFRYVIEDSKMRFKEYIIIVDLKNNLITKPLQHIETYSSSGLIVFDDPKSNSDFLVRPIFGSCIKPTSIALNKEALKWGPIPNIMFNDNTHFVIQYIDQGAEMAEDNLTIDPAKIFAQCGQQME